MNQKTTFNTGLRIGEVKYGPCQWHDDQFVTVDGTTVSIFATARDEAPLRTYSVPAGTEIFCLDDEGEFLLGRVS